MSAGAVSNQIVGRGDWVKGATPRFCFTGTMKSMRNQTNEYSDPQKKTLRQLLHELEKAQKADILAYSFGHLNQRNLHKLLGQQKGSVTWESAKKPTPSKKVQKCMSIQQSKDTKVNKMTDALVDFSLMASILPISPTDYCPVLNDLDQNSARASQNTPYDSMLSETKACSGTPHTETQKLKYHFIKEELELSTLMLIKPQIQKCARSHTGHDQSQFVESYLAGLTRKDQFSKLLEFEKKILMKQDLLEREAISGYKAVAKHEWKLNRELMEIGHLPGPNLRRLQVFSDVFEDICQDSIVFCEILREIKAEYDLYLTSLLESQPTDQHQSLQAQLQAMNSRTVKTHHVEEARQKVLNLEQEARHALQRNDELRNELERELSKSEPLPKQQVAEAQSNLKHLKIKTKPLSVMEQVLSLRSRIYKTTVKIQELESELKNSMVPSVITKAMQSSIRDTQGEVAKLQKSNEFLRSKIKALENYIERTLIEYKVNKDGRENLWHMIKDIVDPAESKNATVSVMEL
ncbi:uncharacterized protein C6orf118-like isoform X2 [Heterodontus francisci]|uniref:uncharacterized protein C6orf118-like isoform X2 n=1 Tax=Heterodontus francisci TaxID=7792 RepID=UPI00355B6AE2